MTGPTSGAADQPAHAARPGDFNRMSNHLGLAVFLAAFAYALALVPGDALRDADTLWHVRTGQWILENGRWPHADPFSHTFFGSPWMAKEWLSQVILAVTFAAGGWRAVVTLTSAVYAAIAAVLTIYLMRLLRFSVALGLALITFLLLGPHFLARPHIFAYLIMSVWLFALLEAYDKGRAPPLWMAGLMLLWANMHGTFALGLAVFYVACADLCAREIKTRNSRRIKQTLLVLFAVTLAVFITPYGLDSLLVTWRIMGMKAAMAHISEWQPPSFRDYPLALAYLLGLFASITAFGLKLAGPRLVIFLMAMWLGLSYQRGFMVFLLIVPFIFARPAAQQVAYLAASRFGGEEPIDPVLRFVREHARGIAVVAGALAAIATVFFWQVRSINFPARVVPAAAMSFVEQAKVSGKVFNSYDFGGYLIFTGIPTFVDGRAELYGEEFLEKYFAAVRMTDPRAGIRMLEDYEIDWALLRPVEPLTRALIGSAGWTVLFSDDTAMVLTRAQKQSGSRQSGAWEPSQPTLE